MRFDCDYRERATLKSGREVIIRLLRPSDKPRLARGFYKLSEENRYRRFLTGKPRLTDAELDYLVDVDQQSHLAIGAVEPSGDLDEDGEGEGLGVARCIVDAKDPSIADAAITVADDAQGVGLGTLLFRRLTEAALERGIRRFRGEILAGNEAMLAITRGVATNVRPTVESGVAIVEFDLPGAETPEPEAHAHQSALLRWFASGAASAKSVLAWRWGAGDDS